MTDRRRVTPTLWRCLTSGQCKNQEIFDPVMLSFSGRQVISLSKLRLPVFLSEKLS